APTQTHCLTTSKTPSNRSETSDRDREHPRNSNRHRDSAGPQHGPPAPAPDSALHGLRRRLGRDVGTEEEGAAAVSIRVKPVIWDPDYPNRRAAGVQLFADNGTLCFIK